LKESVKESSFLKFSSEDEIWPSNLLFERSNQATTESFEKSFRILLVKLLAERSSDWDA
jgi:hypothetical protein